VLDDFIVERRLGEGGLGTVYLLQSRSTACDWFQVHHGVPHRLSGCPGAEIPQISSGIFPNSDLFVIFPIDERN
jgi:hypothetical protein